MIPRYTRPELGQIWSDENKYRQWLNVELAAAETLAELGEIPTEAAQALRQYADFDVARIDAIEAEVRHDIIAFTTAVSEKMAAAGQAEHSRWLHFGLTSNDVVDTAQALLIKQSSVPIAAKLGELRQVLNDRAHEFKDTVIVGRTHGVHAEPTTFGLKLANWYSEVSRHLKRFDDAREQMRVGKSRERLERWPTSAPRPKRKSANGLGSRPPQFPPRLSNAIATPTTSRHWRTSPPRSRK